MKYIIQSLIKLISSALFVVPAVLILLIILFTLGIHPILLGIYVLLIIGGFFAYRAYKR